MTIGLIFQAGWSASTIGQLDPDLHFQRLHLMAHCALGTAQLPAARVKLSWRSGLKGLESIELRKGRSMVANFMKKTKTG